MGQEIASSHFGREDFAEFNTRLEAETRLLEQWFKEGFFSSSQPSGGFELECCLLDKTGNPAPINQQLLDKVDNPLVVPELATFNFEINSTPRILEGDVFSRMAGELRGIWDQCSQSAAEIQAQLGMFGILPTLRQEDLTLANMSPLNRYQALNEQVFRLRLGAPVELAIEGRNPLHLQHADVMLESAATSFQIHLQVNAKQSSQIYNLSKIISAPMVAVSANSPFLFRHQLWHETRIPLFEQSISVGASDLTKRVSFGIRYVRDSIIENFTANLRRYPVLLPKLMDEPIERLAHLRLHNGTIWRWNRPLIGFNTQGKPHLRIEHRVVPAGPSIVDSIANAALYFGLVAGLMPDATDIEKRLKFSQARSNFYTAARWGLDAEILWCGWQKVKVSQLLLNLLLPKAREGLASLALDRIEIDRWLGIIEQRILKKQTGADWQLAWTRQHGCNPADLTQAYLEHQKSGAPVHEWV